MKHLKIDNSIIKVIIIKTIEILSGFGTKESHYINNFSKLEEPQKFDITTLSSFEIDSVNNIKMLLANQLEIPAKELSLISYKRILWEDSSIGCPQLGHLYSQNIIPGVKLTLQAHGKEYNYHGDTSYNFIYCNKKNIL